VTPSSCLKSSPQDRSAPLVPIRASKAGSVTGAASTAAVPCSLRTIVMIFSAILIVGAKGMLLRILVCVAAIALVQGEVQSADCPADQGCLRDAPMALLTVDKDRLAAGVHSVITVEEQARGKFYAIDERHSRVRELEQTLARLGMSSNPLMQEASRLIDQQDFTAAKAKLEAVPDADDEELAEAERTVAERRKRAARNARDLAALLRGTDAIKAVKYYERALQLDPSEPDVWFDYAEAAITAGNRNDARSAFVEAARRAHERGQALVASKATYRQGDMALEQGNLPAAQALFEAGLAIILPLANADLGKTELQLALTTSQEKIGAVLQSQGKLAAALDSYRASLGSAERLAMADPGNTYLERNLLVSHNRIGGVLRAQGNLPEALQSYRDSLEIAKRLTEGAPSNADWQWALSVAHDSIGDVLRAQGDLPEAVQSYRALLGIAERLIKADPGNVGWQHVLAVGHGKIGNVLEDQGILSPALQSYRAAHDAFSNLAKVAPGNPARQRDLALSHGRIGRVLARQGAQDEATAAFGRGQAILSALLRQLPNNSGLPSDLAWFEDQLADLKN
jgi:tetratricopeptide (TPR) repeat protein